MSTQQTSKEGPTRSTQPASPAKAPDVQMRTELAGQSYTQQSQTVRPAMPVQMQAAVQQTGGGAAPPTTGWTTRVRANFAAWDTNNDGWLGMSEVNTHLQNPAITGDDAAALSALHRYLEQLEELSATRVPAAELDRVRRVVLTCLVALNDSREGLVRFSYLRSLVGQPGSRREFRERLLSVTSEDIRAVAQTVALDTVFFLSSAKASL